MTGEALNQLGGFAVILGLFSAVILFGVRLQLRHAAEQTVARDKRLTDHIDGKFSEVTQTLDSHKQRLDQHDNQINQQHLANLELRNEMLESMRDKYVRHDDIVEIRKQITAVFAKLDKVMFRKDKPAESVNNDR